MGNPEGPPPARPSVPAWRAPLQRAVAIATGVLAAAALALATAHTAVGGPVLLALALVAAGVVLAVRRPQLLDPGALRWAILAAIATRLLVAFVAQTRPETDFLVFWQEAGSISADGAPALATVLKSTKAPAVVLLYGLGRWLVDDHLWVAYVANALLGGVQVLLTARIARRLVPAPGVAVAAAWLVALFPSLVLHSAVISSEVLFMTCILGAADALLWSLTQPSARIRLAGAAGAGVLLAAAHFSRNVALLHLAPWLVAVVLVPVANPRRLLGPIATMAGVFVLVCVPQLSANVTDYGWYSISSSDAAGTNLLFGTNRDSRGGWNEADVQMLAEEGFVAGDHESVARQQEEARRLGIERITDDPGGFAWFALTDKYDRMWGSDRGGVEWAVAGSPTLDPPRPAVDDPAVQPDSIWPTLGSLLRIADAWYLAVLVLATFGAAALARGRDPGERFTVTFLAGPVAATALFHLVWEVQPRYHLPVLPFAAVLAASGAAWLWDLASAPATRSWLGALGERLRDRPPAPVGLHAGRREQREDRRAPGAPGGRRAGARPAAGGLLERWGKHRERLERRLERR